MYEVIVTVYYCGSYVKQSGLTQEEAYKLAEKLNDTCDMYTYFDVQKMS